MSVLPSNALHALGTSSAQRVAYVGAALRTALARFVTAGGRQREAERRMR